MVIFGFRSRGISWGDILLNFLFSFSELRYHYFISWITYHYVKEKLEMFTGIFVGRWCKWITLKCRKKIPNFQFWRHANWPWQYNYSASPSAARNLAFHLQEFQWKLFFTRNWVGEPLKYLSVLFNRKNKKNWFRWVRKWRKRLAKHFVGTRSNLT